MEINRASAAQPQRPVNLDPIAAQPAAGQPEPAERRDRIELSDAARQIGQQPVDGTREALLRQVRAQLDAGTYRIDADGVARRIVAREDL